MERTDKEKATAVCETTEAKSIKNIKDCTPEELISQLFTAIYRADSVGDAEFPNVVASLYGKFIDVIVYRKADNKNGYEAETLYTSLRPASERYRTDDLDKIVSVIEEVRKERAGE